MIKMAIIFNEWWINHFWLKFVEIAYLLGFAELKKETLLINDYQAQEYLIIQ